MHNILVVDDDVELCQLLQEYLSKEGFSVTSVHNGNEAATALNSDHFHLMILDIMLPGKNGLDVLREVRNKSHTPILMLTAKGDEIDRIVGLELGADDYLPKPCNHRELVARIRSIIRRSELSHRNSEQTYPDIELQNLIVSRQKREVSVAQSPIELTATEFQILLLLTESAGDLVTREQISEACLGRKLMTYDRSIDMHISHLRKKLGLAIDGQERIKTIRGVGYQYVAI